MEKKKVAVIFGGHSSEYKVSLHSAHAILTYMDREKYKIIPIGITKEGDWFRYNGNYDNILDDSWHEDASNCIPVVVSLNQSTKGIIELTPNGNKVTKIDVAFPILHGKMGKMEPFKD